VAGGWSDGEIRTLRPSAEAGARAAHPVLSAGRSRGRDRPRPERRCLRDRQAGGRAAAAAGVAERVAQERRRRGAHAAGRRGQSRPGRMAVRVAQALEVEQADGAPEGDHLTRGLDVGSLVGVGRSGEDRQLAVVRSGGNGVIGVVRGVGMEIEARRDEAHAQQQGEEQDLEGPRATRSRGSSGGRSSRSCDGAVDDHVETLAKKAAALAKTAAAPAGMAAALAERIVALPETSAARRGADRPARRLLY